MSANGVVQETARCGFTSLQNVAPDVLTGLVARSVELFRGARPMIGLLTGRSVGIWFQQTSTRTRMAFSTATVQLGGAPLSFGAGELQLSTGETPEDTARVMGCMLDGIVIRSAMSSSELDQFGELAGIPVVNAMSSDEHPTQGVCDLATLLLHRGSLDRLHVLYVGEGNNSASALALAAARSQGLHLRLLVPPGYGLSKDLVKQCHRAALACGGSVVQDHDVADGAFRADVVYTTRWQTTGTTKPDRNWRHVFGPFQVSAQVMARYPGALFMHDLPAHRGEEVTADVIDGANSICWDQARMKKYSAIAVLEHVFAPG